MYSRNGMCLKYLSENQNCGVYQANRKRKTWHVYVLHSMYCTRCIALDVLHSMYYTRCIALESALPRSPLPGAEVLGFDGDDQLSGHDLLRRVSGHVNCKEASGSGWQRTVTSRFRSFFDCPNTNTYVFSKPVVRTDHLHTYTHAHTYTRTHIHTHTQTDR